VIDKKGVKWVKFTVTNNDGKQVTLEKKVLRISKVKRHFGEMQERAVIQLGVCISDVYKEIEVNIVDRSGLVYPMLIGRNYLAGEFLIDTDDKFRTKPQCKQ